MILSVWLLRNEKESEFRFIIYFILFIYFVCVERLRNLNKLSQIVDYDVR